MSVISLSVFFFSSRRRHTRSKRDWSSNVCSSDLGLSSGGWRSRFLRLWLLSRGAGQKEKRQTCADDENEERKLSHAVIIWKTFNRRSRKFDAVFKGVRCPLGARTKRRKSQLIHFRGQHEVALRQTVN